MRCYCNVKIVVMFGFVFSSYEMICVFYEVGVDVFCLNMSYGSYFEIVECYEIICKVEKDCGLLIGILVDFQGFKLCVGIFVNGEEMLEIGQDFCFDLDDILGDVICVCLLYKEIFDVLELGVNLLVNDGKICLKVKDCGCDFVNCEVIVFGVILNCKGVNVFDVVLLLVVLLDKDCKDLEFVCDLGVDWFVLLFVQCFVDMNEVCDLVKGCVVIFVKIEKFVVVKVFDEIFEVLDGIMVVCGDFGVELLVLSVLLIQKCLICKCCVVVKLVIVVIQMFELMIESLMLICVEVFDVVNVIYEGIDVIMLLVELVVGQYLVEVVIIMSNVVVEVESDLNYVNIIGVLCQVVYEMVVDGIVVVVCEIVEIINVKVICCFLQLGVIVLIVVCECLYVLIIVLIMVDEIVCCLCLIWGVNIVIVDEVDCFKFVVIYVVCVVKVEGIVIEKDMIVVIVGVFFNIFGFINIFCVVLCEECLIYSVDKE